jgi:hypothetical protein
MTERLALRYPEKTMRLETRARARISSLARLKAQIGL